eukprot:scaffold5122_cov48-Phaeocystis_antarctica.AAC.1
MQLEPRPSLTLTLTPGGRVHRFHVSHLQLGGHADRLHRRRVYAKPHRARTPGQQTSRATTGDPHATALQTGLLLTHVWAPPWTDETLGGPWAKADPFSGFIATLQYRFLPLLMLVFLLINAVTGRDFGPMLDEERAALP